MKTKRLAAEAARAVTQVAAARSSISALNDEDLLDLADIFSGKPQTLISDTASAELKRRNLSLEAHLDQPMNDGSALERLTP